MTNNSYDTDDLDTRVRAALDAVTVDVVASDALLERIHREAAEAPGHRGSRRRIAWAATAAVVVLVAAVGILSMAGGDGEPVVIGRADRTTVAPPAAASGPSVALTSTDTERLVASTSELAPHDDGWLGHTITITNTGDGVTDVQLPRTTSLLGDDEVIATLAGGECAPPLVQSEPASEVDPVCVPPVQSLGPGAQLVVDVLLLPIGDVTSDTLSWSVPVLHTSLTTDETDDASRAEAGEIVVTYTDLAEAAPSDTSLHDTATTEPPGTTSIEQPATTTTMAIDADLTRIEGTYTGTSNYTFGTGGCAEQDHRVALDVTLADGTRASYTARLCAAIVDGTWSGTGPFTLTMPEGGTLTGDVTSTAPLPTDGVPYRLTITGGTGSFEGSSGSCDVTVLVHDVGGGHQIQTGSIFCSFQS
ncbi:MAG: hypothetical protein JJU45_12025 [Acidimicrobiia bacterium]|nr:hypothetical protein [Acidimicrobiia bacterium]